MPESLSDEEVSVSVDGNPGRPREGCFRGRTSVSSESEITTDAACEGREDFRDRVHLSNPRITAIGDVDIAGSIDGDTAGLDKEACVAGPPSPSKASTPVPGMVVITPLAAVTFRARCS